jgi:hypothetical protein
MKYVEERSNIHTKPKPNTSYTNLYVKRICDSVTFLGTSRRRERKREQ